ncbi:hypothetical protein WN944_026380 [Citrus x changshan-huyou]|uniref:Uncharacterized protein n=1 Tax=Citrus x changshan-huyou TaxID=2935761 RepID=A0AAP0QD75_9ROSI
MPRIVEEDFNDFKGREGKEELVKHFRSFDFPCDEYLPVCFSPARDGTRKNVKQSTVGKCRGTS